MHKFCLVFKIRTYSLALFSGSPRLFCGIHVSRRTHCTHWSTRIETYYLHTPVCICVYLCICVCAYWWKLNLHIATWLLTISPRRLTLSSKVFAPRKQLVWPVSRVKLTISIFIERYTVRILSLLHREKCAAGRKVRNSYYYSWHLNTCAMLYYVQ